MTVIHTNRDEPHIEQKIKKNERIHVVWFNLYKSKKANKLILGDILIMVNI